jgi:hypothetical protein
VVVRLSNDNVGAPLRDFCEMLGLHYSTQVQKVQRHPAIYDKLVLVLLKTSGGPQEANVIIAEAIPIWLTSMHISRVAPNLVSCCASVNGMRHAPSGASSSLTPRHALSQSLLHRPSWGQSPHRPRRCLARK